MPKLGSAYVEVKTDRKGLKPGLDKAKRQVTKSTTEMQSVIDRINWRAVGIGASAMAATVGFAVSRAIGVASDLEEVTSKFNVVFEGQTELAEKWSKQLVNGYAMSTRESKQYLASVQDLLVPMGMQADAAGRMSSEVVKLAADLGSFNNLPTAQVIGDMQSALVGNFETMKKYGVVLNATVVQQRALEMGLADSKNELTAAHRAQAAYMLMLGGSAAATGDMARTSGSYANQVKALNAAVEDLTAAVGQEFLPLVTSTIRSLNEFARALLAAFNPDAYPIETLDKQIAELKEKLLMTSGGGFFEWAKNDARELTDELERLMQKRAELVGDPGSDMPVAGDTTAGDRQAEIEAAQTLLDIDTERYRILEQYELEAHEASIARAEQAIADKEAQNATELELDIQRHQIKEQYEQQAHMSSIRLMDEETKHRQAATQTAVNRSKWALRELGKDSKIAFAAYKALAISEAVITGYKAAINAWEQGQKIGGPPMAAAFAAASLLWTGAQIAAIGGSQQGGGGSGAVPTYTASPDTGLPETEDSESRGTLHLHFNGTVVGDEEAIADFIVEKINNASDRDVYIEYARDTV